MKSACSLYRLTVASLLIALVAVVAPAQQKEAGTTHRDGWQTFSFGNSDLRVSVVFEKGVLLKDVIEGEPGWLMRHEALPAALCTDGDFLLTVVWTDWRAPGKKNNADNPVSFSKKDFLLRGEQLRENADGSKEYEFLLKGSENDLDLKLIYRLESGSFYARRRIALRDTANGYHYLEQIAARQGRVFVESAGGVSQQGAVRIEESGDFAGVESGSDVPAEQHGVSIEKKGDFGQPVALHFDRGGAFFGLERPTSQNSAAKDPHGSIVISCSQMIGRKIGKEWLESEWVVGAITPDPYVKLWFMRYVDDIRVAPLRPFTLYNSWYDLRSAEFPGVPEANVMNEKNVLRMVDLVKKNMVERHGITMDAFVLDDGWDIYESDWVLRDKQFPNGLKPITAALRQMKTSLGMWFGPTGGYSSRMKRIDWMRGHGYETVGGAPDREMLCLAGQKYSQLFKKRVVDLVTNDGVGYFKWDGIQFSCSEPNHGHPVGIYSREAVLESVIDKCRAVREKNPDIFLNITSGTWLSPWWVKYTNTIWMDGADYGFANVPSLTPRENGITYRDFALYDDFKKKDLWFPIANLMTHGTIKARLEGVSFEGEPLDTFTDDALLYLARGVSMYELYISPDILTGGEWDAISKSILWAKDRFNVLSSTEMIGGNALLGEAYGYVHFKGRRGIIAVRNPVLDRTRLVVRLDPAHGMDPKATSLVLERVYPTRWISPRLYAAGVAVDLPLDAYETAIYELYPLEEAERPLLAGFKFDVAKNDGLQYHINAFDAGDDVRVLNPELIREIGVAGKSVPFNAFTLPVVGGSLPVLNGAVSAGAKGSSGHIDVRFDLDSTAKNSSLSLLLKQGSDCTSKDFPAVAVDVDGAKAKVRTAKQDGSWAWYSVPVESGKHVAAVRLSLPAKGKTWNGTASVWVFCQQEQRMAEISLVLTKPAAERPMPPAPCPVGRIKKTVKLGEATLTLK